MRRVAGSLFVLVLFAGCGAAPAPTPSGPGRVATTSASASASPRSSDAALGINITLAGGKADPNGERVPLEKGTRLELTITSDHADEVHVHGYDIEIEVAAGATVTKEILLDQVGKFEVESHEPQLTILELIVS